MSNRNEYNYYKNEYGKYKANYYSPGSEEYKKRQSGSRKQKAARILRAFVVFVIIAAIVVGIVFGIIKLSAVINDRIGNKETTTVPTTEVTTLPKKEESNDNKFKKGTKCIVKTEEGTGVNLRSKPTYDVAGYQLVVDGETVVIDEISEDGKWCKTSNFDKNGWLNLKYLQIVTEENTTKNTEETTTEKATEKPTEKPTDKPTDYNTVISVANMTAESTETIDVPISITGNKGICGATEESCSWKFFGDGELIIYGNGNMNESYYNTNEI